MNERKEKTMDSKMYVYVGKLGEEFRIGTIPMNENFMFPNKGELVCVPFDEEGNDVPEGIVYKVRQVLMDYIANEYSIFVKPYNWDI